MARVSRDTLWLLGSLLLAMTVTLLVVVIVVVGDHNRLERGVQLCTELASDAQELRTCLREAQE